MVNFDSIFLNCLILKQSKLTPTSFGSLFKKNCRSCSEDVQSAALYWSLSGEQEEYLKFDVWLGMSE